MAERLPSDPLSWGLYRLPSRPLPWGPIPQPPSFLEECMSAKTPQVVFFDEHLLHEVHSTPVPGLEPVLVHRSGDRVLWLYSHGALELALQELAGPRDEIWVVLDLPRNRLTQRHRWIVQALGGADRLLFTPGQLLRGHESDDLLRRVQPYWAVLRSHGIDPETAAPPGKWNELYFTRSGVERLSIPGQVEFLAGADFRRRASPLDAQRDEASEESAAG